MVIGMFSSTARNLMIFIIFYYLAAKRALGSYSRVTQSLASVLFFPCCVSRPSSVID
jgi:hypothetical protein